MENQILRVLDLSVRNLNLQNTIEQTSVNIMDKIPVFNEEWLQSLPINSVIVMTCRSIGTLGGGNHFVEFERSEELNKNISQSRFPY